ncbi:MAG TPA: hypothetical protein P5550_08970 [Bacteroidales bacterium]|nr:hypothetical protein [Bacteroidales bacterium]
MRHLRITLLVLILLTLVASFMAENLAGLGWITFMVILGSAWLKFLGVAWYFMQIRQAHRFWKVVVPALSGAILAGVVLAAH